VPGRAAAAEAGDIVTFAVAATALGRLRDFPHKELGA
jgi:trk system potassium uptake protein TrkA